jgi:hypothetical protein
MNALNNTSGYLIIVLAITLVVFLIAAIVAVVKLISVLNSMKRLAEKAEKLADSAAAVGEFFSKATGPMALGKILGNVTDFIKRRKKG